MDARDPIQVLFAAILPRHGFQYPRRSALHRQVNVVAERGHGIDRRDDVRRKVARMRSGKAYPANPGNLAHRGQQLGEGQLPFAVVVGVDVLPQQLDLGVTRFGQRARLGQHGSGGPAPLLPRVNGTTQ